MKTFLTLSILLIVVAACGQKYEKAASSEAELSPTSNDTEIQNLTKQNEVLQGRIYELEGQLGKIKSQPEAEVELTQADKDVQTLVNEVHTRWENLASGGGVNSMLVFFLPKYTTSSVNVDISDFVKVRRHNNSNFEEHLQALSEIDGLSIKFDKTQILYSEIRGDVFTTCYRSRIQVFQNGKLQMTKSVIALMAGENRGGWKIGNYSWVTLDYLVNS